MVTPEGAAFSLEVGVWRFIGTAGESHWKWGCGDLSGRPGSELSGRGSSLIKILGPC